MKMKEFRLADVVRRIETRKIPGKISDFPKQPSGPYTLPAIAAGSRNQGIACYVRPEDADILQGVISVAANGDGYAFYQSKPFTILQDAYAVEPIGHEPTEGVCLYLTGVIQKLLSQAFGWTNKSGWNKVKDYFVSLPATTVMAPDWTVLEALLKTGGGEVADMSKIDTSSWKKFKVSDLFGKAKLGKYHNPETLTADPKGYEYICASNLNNGVNKDLPRVTGANLQLTAPNIIAWGKQCPMFTYHKDPCVTSQGMYYIELDKLSEACALFIITLLEHACKGQYGYNNCLIGSKFDEIEISLPVTAVEQPDWDYMQERIAELEQERIAELEQYLIAAGLNDYTLTEEDLEILRLFRGEAA